MDCLMVKLLLINFIIKFYSLSKCGILHFIAKCYCSTLPLVLLLSRFLSENQRFVKARTNNFLLDDKRSCKKNVEI